jgi:uncharacterized protein YbjT (DUF2867 family)
VKIAVIGGSGLIGSKVVSKLRGQGHDVQAPSRDAGGVNTITGEGLPDGLAGAAVVIDVSNSPSFEDAAATEFFRTSTGNLLAAEKETGVGHHVALSVVGSERMVESGYMRAKITQERLIRESSIPFSIVHATQFFEFVAGIADAATDGDTVRLAPALIRPIAADDVAAVVARVAVGPPVNGVVEVAGPDTFQLDELIRRALAARDDPREVIVDPHSRYFGVELSQRMLLPDDTAKLGATHFEDWLTKVPFPVK